MARPDRCLQEKAIKTLLIIAAVPCPICLSEYQARPLTSTRASQLTAWLPVLRHSPPPPGRAAVHEDPVLARSCSASLNTSWRAVRLCTTSCSTVIILAVGGRALPLTGPLVYQVDGIGNHQESSEPPIAYTACPSLHIHLSIAINTGQSCPFPPTWLCCLVPSHFYLALAVAYLRRHSPIPAPSPFPHARQGCRAAFTLANSETTSVHSTGHKVHHIVFESAFCHSFACRAHLLQQSTATRTDCLSTAEELIVAFTSFCTTGEGFAVVQPNLRVFSSILTDLQYRHAGLHNRA
ncbi:hypothetical protein J1614_006609 [Plenodomus biglobosus]|nr:hypothetical protein J1614_006609 [Plenodomus biglobosus]